MPPPARIDPHHPPGGAGLLGQQHAALALPGVGRRHRDGQGLRARRRPRDPRRPKAAPSRRPAWRCAGRCCVACGVGGGPGPAPGIGSGEREPAEPIPALRLGTATARAAPPAGPRRVQARRPGPVGRLHRPAPASARLRRPCLADGCGRAFARHARPGRTAPGRRRPARSLPACKDRLAGPERQDAAPPRAGLAGWPVRHPTAPPRDAATAGGVPGRQPGDTAGPPAPDRPAVRVHQCPG